MSLTSKQNPARIYAKSNIGTVSEEVTLSFRFLTSNDDYNFSFFGKSKNEGQKTKAALYDRIEDITKNSWLHWHNLSKFNGGIERIPAKELKFKPCSYEFSDGDKVIIFRFNGDKYRIIGLKIENSPCFYVIGFDFDHSAYDHGS